MSESTPGGPKLSQSTPVALGLVVTLALLAFNIGDRWSAQREQERRILSLEASVKEHTTAVTTLTTQMGHLLGGMQSLEQTMKESPPRRQR